MTQQALSELVADAKGKGITARLAACALAAHFRLQLGYAPINA